MWKPLIYKNTDLSNKYLISDSGEIFSMKSKKKLHQTIGKTGYYGVCVSNGSRKEKLLIKTHVAVALNFVDGYKDDLIVNHKDGNKLNNNASNLEWVTCRENTRHAYKTGLMKNKSIKIICIETGEVFCSVREAAAWCGLNEKGTSINEYLKRKSRKSAGKHPITGQPLTWKIA